MRGAVAGAVSSSSDHVKVESLGMVASDGGRDGRPRGAEDVGDEAIGVEAVMEGAGETTGRAAPAGVEVRGGLKEGTGVEVGTEAEGTTGAEVGGEALVAG